MVGVGNVSVQPLAYLAVFVSLYPSFMSLFGTSAAAGPVVSITYSTGTSSPLAAVTCGDGRPAGLLKRLCHSVSFVLAPHQRMYPVASHAKAEISSNMIESCASSVNPYGSVK